ncbi:MAG: nucleoside triphosphate pyrophosphohydrolase [Mariprofundaceae bacterium]|nr:nucleoside triphosphate pyrophosphohydrolase [Mariprofundaceae bacterium]
MPQRIHNIPDTFLKLQTLMKILRDECPWDKKQTMASLRTCTLEEVHEVLEAIDAKDWPALQDELGDLLLQILFYTCLASEQNHFDLEDVAQGLIDKMIRRHPHVFANVQTDDVLKQWNQIKDQEQQRKSLMDGVPPLPSLAKAQKIQQRAARIGFDWQDAQEVLPKIREELQEFEEAFAEKNQDHIEDEFGDLLFTLTNLGRKLGLDSELCLMRSNRKFERRFRGVEDCAIAENKALDQQDTEQLEVWYQQVKESEKDES